MRLWRSLAVVLVLTTLGCSPPATDAEVSGSAPVTPSSTADTTMPVSPPTTSFELATTTTELPAAVPTTTTLLEPPRLEVVDPIHGETVTTPRYTFRGITDPGCAITVGGKYHAEVSADGTWALDLMLVPGRNSTTFVANDVETGLQTKQAIRVYYAEPLELRADGLGAVTFGMDEDTTMAILISLLGEPDYASVCNNLDYCVGAGYGWCRYISEARWESEKISIVIGDCETRDGGWPDAPELMGWRAWQGTMLRMPEGVGPGSTLGELEATYGDRLFVGYDDCAGGLYLDIRDTNGGGGFHGYVATPPGFELPDDYRPSEHQLELDPATPVVGFEAGVGQSC